jgi:hypothetical protein
MCVEVASYQLSIAIAIAILVVTTTRRIVWALRSVFGVTCSAGCGVVAAARVDDSSFSASAQGVREEPVQDSLAQARSWRWGVRLGDWLVVLRGLTLGVRTSGRRFVVTRVQRLSKPSLRGLTLGGGRNSQWSIILRGLTSVLASPGNMDLLLWQAASTPGVVGVDMHPIQHVRLRSDRAVVFASDHAPVLLMSSERSTKWRRNRTALTALVVLGGSLVVVDVGVLFSHIVILVSVGLHRNYGAFEGPYIASASIGAKDVSVPVGLSVGVSGRAASHVPAAVDFVDDDILEVEDKIFVHVDHLNFVDSRTARFELDLLAVLVVNHEQVDLSTEKAADGATRDLRLGSCVLTRVLRTAAWSCIPMAAVCSSGLATKIAELRSARARDVVAGLAELDFTGAGWAELECLATLVRVLDLLEVHLFGGESLFAIMIIHSGEKVGLVEVSGADKASVLATIGVFAGSESDVGLAWTKLDHATDEFNALAVDAIVREGVVFDLLQLVLLDESIFEVGRIVKWSKVAWVLQSDWVLVIVVDNASHHCRQAYDTDFAVCISVDWGRVIQLVVEFLLADQAR